MFLIMIGENRAYSGWIILAPHGVEYHSFRRLRGEAIRQYAGNVATWRELRKIGWRCVKLKIEQY